MSQDELARRLHWHQTYVSKREKGRRDLTVMDYLLWAKELGVDPLEPIAELAAEMEQRKPRRRVKLK